MVPILEVYDPSSGSDLCVGSARFSLRRGVISTTFEYSAAWLASTSDSYSIDPSLPLMPGFQHVVGIPGAFRDSSPDRWGRTLIERDYREKQNQKGEALRQFDDVDFLVGVFDQTREGSLRFREPDGSFLAESSAIPPLLQLPQLLHASREVALHEAGHQEIKELLAAGSGSLGGARPKASVCGNGKLLLAKFSHPSDEWDVMAWEKTMLDLASEIGISVPASQLIRIGDESVLLLERFDRADSLIDGRRIPYMSAMTALQSSDGEARDYAELAEATTLLTKDASRVLSELFIRVVFSVAVGNTDDHLRNWAFLRQEGAWKLSPLFDVNPNPYLNAQRVTTIAGERRANEIAGLKDLVAFCGLTTQQARAIASQVCTAVATWETKARHNGCPERELSLFRPLFEQKLEELKHAFC